MKRKLFILLLLTNLLAAQIPTQELFIQWGENPAENVRYRVEPGCYFGPQSFAVQDSIITLLDPVNKSLKKFISGHLSEQTYAPAKAKDFVVKPDKKFSFLVENKTQKYSEHFKVVSLNKNHAEISVTNNDGGFKIDLNHYENNLGCMQIIGADKYNRLYLDVDLIVKEIPLEVDRQIWIINYSGEKLGKINIPTHYFTSIHKDLILDKNGIIHHMISSHDGIYIFKWDIPDIIPKDYNGKYPKKFQKHLHYNEFEYDEEKSQIEPSLHKKTTTVSRDKTLEIADTYVKHQWTCTTANVTDGVETAPDGDLVQTPDWINIGTNFKIPYKWGGFNTLSEYDAGMSSGKYAGDIHTDGVSSYARGVDCSGYVCRCWQMSSHYSTRMMDNPTYGPITLPVSSWSEIKPGDAIHKHGHVRLAVKRNVDGTISAVEAAGSSTDWRVDYTHYTLSQLSSYSPRYYIYMEDADVPPESPVLTSVIFDESINIEWSLTDTSNCDGILLEFFNEDEDWEEFYTDSLFPVDNTSCTESFDFSLISPAYFRLLSVNGDDARTESLPTDSYGYFSWEGSGQKILIVDGFDRIESSGSYHLPYHEFAKWMGDAIFLAGFNFETVANETVIGENILLGDYEAVFWICGDESTADETLSSQEQNLLKKYLDNGGQLFISGSEIGWDLDYKGSSIDKSFYYNYLKAEYVADDSKIYNVTGNSGSIFDSINFSYDNGSHGIYAEDYPDAIKPKNGSTTCLKYSSSYFAGIQYEGAFNGTETGRVVYLSFPWETIVEIDKKNELISRTFDFFKLDPSHIPEDEINISTKFQLSNGYPNPFNNNVKFDLVLPEYEKVSISVYNNLGQKVRTIENSGGQGIYRELSWNGKNDIGQVVSSGVYYFSVNGKSQNLIKPIVFLK